jgi:outer membrane lipoprotein SlyB
MDLIQYTIRFSSIQDEDYVGYHRAQAAQHKHDKWTGAAGLGLVGASLGVASGSGTNAVIGGVAGATAGYLLGKKSYKQAKARSKYQINRYKNADEKDKAYLRRKRELDERNAIERDKVRAQRRIANNMRYR